MLQTLKENFYLILYGITWILSIIKLPKYFDSFLKYLPIIIGYTLCTEVLGVLIYNFEDFSFFTLAKYSYYNVILYNIYDLVFFPFFFYVYWSAISNNRIKSAIKFGALLFILSFFLNAITTDPLKNEMWYAYIIGATVLIISILAYLNYLRINEQTSLISSNLLFWISIGLLIFHVVYLPITIIKNIGLELKMEDFSYLKHIQLFTITVMYSCIILGFFLMRRIRSEEV